MRSFWVYILECSDKSYYVGHTDNLEKRLFEHKQNVIPCYTSKRLPVRLVFCYEFQSRVDALARERQIKGWSRKKKQALISGDWDKLVEYSRSRSSPSTSSGRTEIRKAFSKTTQSAVVSLNTVRGELNTVRGELKYRSW